MNLAAIVRDLTAQERAEADAWFASMPITLHPVTVEAARRAPRPVRRRLLAAILTRDMSRSGI